MKLTRVTLMAATMSASASLAGCGLSLPGMSTGSVFGGGTPAAAAVQNDPVSRAVQVGTTSARAVKCGYNFDPAKLRYQYLAAESAANPADAGKVTQYYDTAFNGVSKAVVAQGSTYCSAAKTRQIKEALNRHLAGDYAPSAPEPVQEEEGLFSGAASSSGGTEGLKSTLPTDNSRD